MGIGNWGILSDEWWVMSDENWVRIDEWWKKINQTTPKRSWRLSLNFVNSPVCLSISIAPKMSAVISKKSFSQLQKSNDCNSCLQLDKQSTLATFPQASAETGNFGKIKLLANEMISNSWYNEYSLC